MDRGCDIRFRKNSSFSFSILKGNGTGGGRDIFEPGSQVLDGRVAGQLLSELVDSLRGLVLVLVDVALEQAALPSGPGSPYPSSTSTPHLLLQLCRRFCCQGSLSLFSKHCQRYNGPEGWVHLIKVTSSGHITSSNTNIESKSKSESRLSINFSEKHQHLQ